MFLTKRLHLSSLNKLTFHLKTPSRQVRLLNFWPHNLRLSQALSAVDPCCFDTQNSCNSRTITFSHVAAHVCNREVEMYEQQLNSVWEKKVKRFLDTTEIQFSSLKRSRMSCAKRRKWIEWWNQSPCTCAGFVNMCQSKRDAWSDHSWKHIEVSPMPDPRLWCWWELE